MYVAKIRLSRTNMVGINNSSLGDGVLLLFVAFLVTTLHASLRPQSSPSSGIVVLSEH